MKDLTIFCGSSRCILCRESLHPCIGCHEARFRRERAKLAEPPMAYYDNPSPPPYFYDSDTTVEDDYYSDGYDRDEDAYYEPRTDGRCFCCGRYHTSVYDDVCAVYLENPEYWNKKMMDAYISTPYQGYRQYHPEEYPEPDGVYACQTEEEKKLAMLEVTLSKLEQYLSAPNLSEEDRISCLVSKCQNLKMKIEIEQRLSPLPDEIRDYSHIKEEVVEDNTTQMSPLSDEESRVEQMVCADDEAEQSEEMNMCTEPLPISIIQINKCGEEGSRKKMRKVTVKDIGRIIIKWLCNNPTYLIILSKKKCLWRVNYRVYVGNSIGKCGLRPDCSASVDILIKIRPRWISDVRYRAFMGNTRGKGALRPP
ncbi:hypothetical protein HanPSC8_Chr03g0090671 [Helianthus annuus]|nr:hypothetical protein HanPSC8_Chr03g0090671 [Helianthus annuus]